MAICEIKKKCSNTIRANDFFNILHLTAIDLSQSICAIRSPYWVWVYRSMSACKWQP